MGNNFDNFNNFSQEFLIKALRGNHTVCKDLKGNLGIY